MLNTYYLKFLRLSKYSSGQKYLVSPVYASYTWPPIGEWTQPINGELRRCENGLHVMRPRDLEGWFYLVEDNLTDGSGLFLIECKGGKKVGEDKVVVRQVRIVRRLKCRRKDFLTSNSIVTMLRKNLINVTGAPRKLVY